MLNIKAKAIRIVVAVLSFIAGTIVFAFAILIKNDTQTKVCRSEFSMKYSSAENTLAAQGEFYLFLEAPKSLVMAVNGTVSDNDKSYVINRRLYFDIERARMSGHPDVKSHFIWSDKYFSDNAPDTLVDKRLFGTKKSEGGRYKAYKINENTIVIGDYFAPIYICQFEK